MLRLKFPKAVTDEPCNTATDEPSKRKDCDRGTTQGESSKAPTDKPSKIVVTTIEFRIEAKEDDVQDSKNSDDETLEGKKVFKWSQDAKTLGTRVRKIYSLFA